MVKNLKEKYDCYLTIAEDKKLITIIDEYLEKINTSNKISSKKNTRKLSDEKPHINLDEYEIVKIIDAEFNECEAYYRQCEKNATKLYNTNKKHIGFYRDKLIDEEEEVPDVMKTKKWICITSRYKITYM